VGHDGRITTLDAGGTTMGDGKDAKECPDCGKEAILESEEEANQEVTHCEWCGAEYPVPEEG
jgi:predicted RNA-binding Zn-ribbon protein involved in translation (DUF1610 family)